MKISFNLSAVALSAQGLDFEVDASTFSPIALEAIFTYGVRRWFQDNINSQAHSHKQTVTDGSAFDTRAAFDARLAAAVSGELSPSRAKNAESALSAFDESLYAVAVENKALPAFAALKKAWADSKGFETAARKTAILAAAAALPEPLNLALKAAAQSRVDMAAALSGIKI